MKPPKKYSLAHKRLIMKEGAVGFLQGRKRNENIYGYSHPRLRELWFQGWDEAAKITTSQWGK